MVWKEKNAPTHVSPTPWSSAMTGRNAAGRRPAVLAKDNSVALLEGDAKGSTHQYLHKLLHIVQ